MTRRLAAILAADVVGYSRLMGMDEAGTLAAIKKHRKELIEPKARQYGGRTVKLMGDGALMEFGSVVDAVDFAADVQRAMAKRNADVAAERRITYRIGVNIGDIIAEGDDIYGDGVNVAARLEAASDPGGICVSDMVHEGIEGKTEVVFECVGELHLKNIAKPIRAWQWRPNATAKPQTVPGSFANEQSIKFCTARDGASIAYAVVGQGPPVFKSPNWMHHLEYDWESPVWGHLLRALARDYTLVRFDQRGNGLSDWNPPEISFESHAGDMETVADAVGIKRFALLGISQGCAISVAYAVRHPDRVSRLVLYGGFARGFKQRGSEAWVQTFDAEQTMILQGWGKNNPAFRQYYTTRFMPGATKEQMDWFNELQRVTVSPENAVRLRQVTGDINVTDLLPQLTVPTLVLHCRDDGIVDFDEGRRMAAMIPNARFVPLEGQNHLILENEPAWPRFMDEVVRFLASDENSLALSGG